MDKTIEKHLLNDSLLFFPIQYSNYINYIYNQLGEYDTPKVYMLILLALRKFSPMSISQIGGWIGIARPNMTAIIDGLTEKGWIKRIPSPMDRRITNIEMTDSGKQFIEVLVEKLYVIMNQQFSMLTEEEASKMAESLEYLVYIGKKLIGEKF